MEIDPTQSRTNGVNQYYLISPPTNHRCCSWSREIRWSPRKGCQQQDVNSGINYQLQVFQLDFVQRVSFFSLSVCRFCAIFLWQFFSPPITGQAKTFAWNDLIDIFQNLPWNHWSPINRSNNLHMFSVAGWQPTITSLWHNMVSWNLGISQKHHSTYSTSFKSGSASEVYF